MQLLNAASFLLNFIYSCKEKKEHNSFFADLDEIEVIDSIWTLEELISRNRK